MKAFHGFEWAPSYDGAVGKLTIEGFDRETLRSILALLIEADGARASMPTTVINTVAQEVLPARMPPAQRSKRAPMDKGDDDAAPPAPKQQSIPETAPPTSASSAEAKPAGWDLSGQGSDKDDAPKEAPAQVPVEIAAKTPEGAAGVKEATPAVTPVKAADGLNVEELAKLTRFTEIIQAIYEAGYKTKAGLLAKCEELRPVVPTLSRVSDMAGRIDRTQSALGIDLA